MNAAAFKNLIDEYKKGSDAEKRRPTFPRVPKSRRRKKKPQQKRKKRSQIWTYTAARQRKPNITFLEN